MTEDGSGTPEGPTGTLSAALQERPADAGRNACEALVAAAAREALPGVSARAFVRRLGEVGAGIRPGLYGVVDLALAGANPLPGNGFRPELDDGTPGQVRHFCGLAAACQRFGAGPTRWVSIHVRRDAPDTPDGVLTDLAIEFVRSLQRGELAVRDAPAWLRRALCAEQPPQPTVIEIARAR